MIPSSLSVGGGGAMYIGTTACPCFDEASTFSWKMKLQSSYYFFLNYKGAATDPNRILWKYHLLCCTASIQVTTLKVNPPITARQSLVCQSQYLLVMSFFGSLLLLCFTLSIFIFLQNSNFWIRIDLHEFASLRCHYYANKFVQSFASDPSLSSQDVSLLLSYNHQL